MDAVAESERRGCTCESASDLAWVWTTSGLMRDGTAEPVSRRQIPSERGEENFRFPLQLTTSRIDNLAPLMPSLLYV